MVDATDIVNSIYAAISGNLNVPTEFLIWPNVLFHLIIPAISAVIIYFCIINKFLKIIKNSLVAFLLSIIFTIFSLPLIIYLPTNGAISLAIAVLAYTSGTPTKTRLLFSIILGAIVFFSYVYVMNFAADYFK